jgi:hypothetical protein
MAEGIADAVLEGALSRRSPAKTTAEQSAANAELAEAFSGGDSGEK